MTIGEVATMWRCSAKHVTREIKAGRLYATKLAGKWVVKASDVARYELPRMSLPPPG